MCCWKSGGREREKILASLSSLPSSGAILPALPRRWPGSRRPSGASTFLELSAGGQSRRNWVSSASSESSFRKRFIWGAREEVTLVVAMPARDGSTQLIPTSPEPQQPDTCSLKVAGMGGETGLGHPRGPATTLGTATGDSHGDGSGDSHGPLRVGRLQLAAWGQQATPGTPGDRGGHLPPGHPVAPRGLLGQPGPPRAPWPARRTRRGPGGGRDTKKR